MKKMDYYDDDYRKFCFEKISEYRSAQLEFIGCFPSLRNAVNEILSKPDENNCENYTEISKKIEEFITYRKDLKGQQNR
ncbi:MAG: hypothetical protein WC269_06565 [Candidatus Gracilibacteria bacterium]